MSRVSCAVAKLGEHQVQPTDLGHDLVQRLAGLLGIGRDKALRELHPSFDIRERLAQLAHDGVAELDF
jgi:hypothetical protein